MVLWDNPLLLGLCGTVENSIEDVPCTSQGTFFLRESCNQLLMVGDHRPLSRRSPHNSTEQGKNWLFKYWTLKGHFGSNGPWRASI